MMEWLTHQHDHGATLARMVPAHGVFITSFLGSEYSGLGHLMDMNWFLNSGWPAVFKTQICI